MVSLINKKAAMFGLDARIALAIFGALSVITGAALYSAIEQSKVIATTSQMDEVVKAYEQHVLDTGLPIRKTIEIDPSSVNGKYELNAEDLLVGYGLLGWKGPYISLEQDSVNASRLIYNSNVLLLIRASNLDWGLTSTANIECVDKKRCMMWVEYDTGSESLANAIDLYVDGVKDPDTGKVRRLGVSSVYVNSGIIYTNM